MYQPSADAPLLLIDPSRKNAEEVATIRFNNTERVPRPDFCKASPAKHRIAVSVDYKLWVGNVQNDAVTLTKIETTEPIRVMCWLSDDVLVANSPAVAPSTPTAQSFRVRRQASRSHSGSRWWDSERIAVPGICLASVAIRACFVETVFGIRRPAIFPSHGCVYRHSLPSTGSLGSVPRLRRYDGVLRLLPVRPPVSCFSAWGPIFMGRGSATACSLQTTTDRARPARRAPRFRRAAPGPPLRRLPRGSGQRHQNTKRCWRHHHHPKLHRMTALRTPEAG